MLVSSEQQMSWLCQYALDGCVEEGGWSCLENGISLRSKVSFYILLAVIVVIFS